MPYAPQQQNQSGSMLTAGVGQGLDRAIKTAGYQIMDPNEELMTSVLRSYGFKLGGGAGAAGAPVATGAAGAGAAGTAGGGGLLAGLKSL